ncbi:conserved hypothetical protein [Trichinella spiralis]|uniref:hypothetical protein n=1 Tax=Trichinella spiralis TaxID=6334 RepID=UPI0001EFBB78|nr:conserved hypothetical protein [Trichinella spiralis]
MFAVSSDSYKNIPARLLNGTGANNESIKYGYIYPLLQQCKISVRLVFHQRIEIVSVGRFRQRTFLGQGDFDSTMQKYMFIVISPFRIVAHKLRVELVVIL